MFQRAAGLVSTAGYGIAVGAPEGATAFADLECLAAGLGWLLPPAVTDAGDPVGALDEWAAGVGLYHSGRRWCEDPDPHWAHQCR